MRQTILVESLQGQSAAGGDRGGRLCGAVIHQPNSDDAAGSIYLGRVDNVVPGMNAAFVDIGLEKKGFLSADDAPREKPALFRGQPVLVQVSGPSPARRGHRLTGRVTMPGRALALLPGQRSAGVSKKITDPVERERLHAVAVSLKGTPAASYCGRLRREHPKTR